MSEHAQPPAAFVPTDEQVALAVEAMDADYDERENSGGSTTETQAFAALAAVMGEHEKTLTRLVHPNGGAVVCQWPMDAVHAGKLLGLLGKLGFEFDRKEAADAG